MTNKAVADTLDTIFQVLSSLMSIDCAAAAAAIASFPVCSPSPCDSIPQKTLQPLWQKLPSSSSAANTKVYSLTLYEYLSCSMRKSFLILFALQSGVNWHNPLLLEINNDTDCSK